MTGLIKHEDNLSLTKKIEFSKQTSLLREHDANSIHDIVKIALITAKQITGYNTSEEDLKVFISEVKKELLSNFKGLHLMEIAITFDLWSKKHYGEWTGFTVSNYITYGLRPYYADQQRIAALKPKEEVKKEEPKKWNGTDRYNQLLAEYKKNGSCDDTGNLVYDWLMETGKLPEKYGSAFYLEAKAQLLKENKTKLITELNTVTRLSIDRSLKQIEANSSNETIVRAKKIAINAYFKLYLERL